MTSNIILCRPDKSPVCVLNSVQENSCSLKMNLNDLNTVSFTVDRYIQSYEGNDIEANGYQELKNAMLLYLSGYGYFRLTTEPVISNDGNAEKLDITAHSIEKELLSRSLVSFKINTGEYTSAEYLAKGNVKPITLDEYYNTPESQRSFLAVKEYVTFYNEDNKELSLLDLVLQKAPGWKVGYVEPELKVKKFSFSEENTNIYTFLRKTLSSTARCIFTFDTENFLINAYSVENLGKDTNVFISMRNLANSLQVSVPDDSIITRFTVAGGDDLNIAQVNFGDSQITNIDYYLTEPYMNKETADKYKAYRDFKETKRTEYISLSKQYIQLQDKSYELKNRVPNDGCATDFDTYSKEELDLALKSFNCQVTLLQIMADDEPQYTDGIKDSSHYIPWKNNNKEIDHERYLAALLKIGGYYDYKAFIYTVIPNVLIAIENIGKTEEEQKKKIDAWETDWSLYGVDELLVKQKSYEEKKEVLKNYIKPWSSLTDTEKVGLVESSWNSFHEEYQAAVANLTTSKAAYDVRLADYNQALTELKSTDDKRKTIVEKVNIKHTNFKFTQSELDLIDSFYVDSDYSNENFKITTVIKGETQIEESYKLFQEAVKQLSQESQPQYEISCDMDNLMAIEEFKDWKSETVCGNFIRVALRDDYFTKLRILSLDFNPLLSDSTNFSITFSNMVKHLQGIDDYEQLLDKSISSAKNSITGNTGKKDGTADIQVSTALLQAIANSSIFGNKFDNIHAEIISATQGNFQNISADFIQAKMLISEGFDLGSGTIKELFSQYISSKFIVTDKLKAEIIEATKGSFEELAVKLFEAQTAVIKQLAGDNLDFVTGKFHDLHADTANIKDLLAGNITADSALLINLTAENARIDKGFIDYLFSNSAIIKDLAGDNLDFKSGFIHELGGQNLDFTSGKFHDLNVDVAKINQIIAGNVVVEEGLFINLTTANVHIADAVIKDLIASKISVADLMAHSATAELITLVSTATGQPSIAFKDGTQQFYDDTGNVRVQIGQDGQGAFNFVVRGSDGTTALFDENGVTTKGIADGLIKNNMLGDNQISKNKLDFPIVETDENGKVSITEILDGSGGSFGIKYTEFTESVTTITNGLNDKIEDSLIYNVEIESSNGNFFKNGEISTVLSCHVYKSNVEITDTLNATAFHWQKINDDGSLDEEWNTCHFGGTKVITITQEDIFGRATFQCNVDGIPPNE